MSKNTAKEQEVWKDALKELSARQPEVGTVDSTEHTSSIPVDTESDQSNEEPVHAPQKETGTPNVFTTQRRKDYSRLGNYHAPAAYDKESLENTKKFIYQVYDQYEGESLEELAGLLEESGIHIHKIFYQNNQDIPAIRAFYHPPIIVELPEKDGPNKEILFDQFYADLTLPKEEETVEEEIVENDSEQLSWWKRIFRKS